MLQITFMIFFKIFEVLFSFLSPQMKPYLIIAAQHGIFECPHEFPNDLKRRILAN